MGKIFEIQFIIFAMFNADKQSAAIHKFQLVDTLLLIQIHYFQYNRKCLIDQNTTISQSDFLFCCPKVGTRVHRTWI